ncbi:MAG: guanylate kinase [Actinomycetes bacterium]
MPRLIVITGPSGVGKGTLIARLLEELPTLAVSVSATTRPPRAGEVDGREYHFLSEGEFHRRQADGRFLESAEYAGNLYGTLVDEVDSRSDAARGVVLEIEVLGAQQVRAKVADAVLIFIAPPDYESLEERLRGRATDSPEQVALRLAQARRELDAIDRFDTVVVNDDLDRAVAELVEQVAVRLD